MADDDKKTASTSSSASTSAPKAADPAPAAAGAPQPLVAPPTVEDPTRAPQPTAAATGPRFPGYPKSKWHPVSGETVVNDPNEEAALVPAHNWFDSPQEADMHRTDTDAQQNVLHNLQVKVAKRLEGVSDPSDAAVRGEAGVVRNSVAATESLKSGNPEPL